VAISVIPSVVSIDGRQLEEDLAMLAEYGQAGPPWGGWTRPAFSPADMAARRYVIQRLRAVGLHVQRDEAGNVRARLPGREPGLPVVMSGSHLDSVPSGGRLDGPLGVAGALAAVEAIRKRGLVPRRSIEIVVFVAEEGSRFPRGTLGSSVLSGELEVADLLRLRDTDGTLYAEALATYGDDALFAGTATLPAPVPAGSVHAFLELHIEQGAVLETSGIPIGAVTAVNGLVQRSVTFTGDANHAGATPMPLRRDALLAAAEWALAIERAAKEAGGGAVATVGRMEVLPGGRNIIPGRVEATCDLRAPTSELLDALDARVSAALILAAARKVVVHERRLQRIDPGVMDEHCITTVEEAAHAAGLMSLRMPSGAIHDALNLSIVAPTSMVFVPSIRGRSHCPDEETEPEHIVAGATVLATALLALAEE
jgi:hydantoinase/carbamoylase family amidase